jgi:hypothetical protein
MDLTINVIPPIMTYPLSIKIIENDANQWWQ